MFFHYLGRGAATVPDGSEIVAVCAAVYAIGFAVTMLYNLWIIVGPVTRPLAVLRNAVLWPVMLPILLGLSGGRRS